MTELPSGCEFLVIGGGMAGASMASELARAGADVALAEAETQPGYHTTGRSAATFLETYGNLPVRALTRASRPFFEQPPEGFCAHDLWQPRGALYVAGPGKENHVEDLLNDPQNTDRLRRVDAHEALGLSPALTPAEVAFGAYEPTAMDIDVDGVLQGYLRGFRDAGGLIATNAQVTGLLRRGGAWEVETRAGTLQALNLVNAAGAWADEIAMLAGSAPVGLVPKRRTIVTFDPGEPFRDWPLTIAGDETWYFRPEAGDLLISPADETPSPPCDAQPEELDVAMIIDRIQTVTRLRVGSIRSKRAGHRNFVHDKTPVVGFADDVEGLFWLAGQGGYGIQAAPALARVGAALAAGGDIPADIAAAGVRAEDLSPARLRL